LATFGHTHGWHPLFAATHAFILSHSGQVLPLSVICAFIFYFFIFRFAFWGGSVQNLIRLWSHVLRSVFSTYFSK